MDTLPPEILEHIFSYLSAEDLINVEGVSTYWKEISQYNSLWRNATYAPMALTSYEKIALFLKRAPKLKQFLTSKPISSFLLNVITQYCPELRKLRLNTEMLSVAQLNFFFEHNTSIEELEVVFIHCRNVVSLSWLRHCTNLTSLQLHGWLYTEEFILKIVAESCPSLKELDIQYLRGYSYEDLYNIFSECPLVRFKMSILSECLCIFDGFCFCVNFESLTLDYSYNDVRTNFHFLGFLSKLKDFTIRFPKSVNAKEILPMFANAQMRNVQRLDLKGCYFNYQVALDLFLKCDNLTTLILSECIGLTDDNLEFIYELDQLQSLTLVECHEITDMAMWSICFCPDLRALYLYNCVSLTNLTPILVNGLKKLSRFKFEPSGPFYTPGKSPYVKESQALLGV